MSVLQENQRFLKAVSAGILCAVALTLVFTCLFGGILLMMNGVPYGIIDYVMIGVQGVSILIGAYIAGVIAKAKGLPAGALCGAVYLLIVFACGLSIAENDISFLTLIRCGVIMLCGIGGGIAGVNRKEKIHIK